jgi:hypothetical protein
VIERRWRKGVGDEQQDNDELLLSDRKGHEAELRPTSVLRDRGGE